eukprot:TRINITY_DN23313_c0_g1_i2.p1 TRINITY_DN23313_c0_g1~~TRINITY_DN23313_c0_g1_i2.p1  ORF type:complete len:118 (+),score=6.10 TRINITY_DN23313_c0_g1_i2:251-604(+)
MYNNTCSFISAPLSHSCHITFINLQLYLTPPLEHCTTRPPPVSFDHLPQREHTTLPAPVSKHIKPINSCTSCLFTLINLLPCKLLDLSTTCALAPLQPYQLPPLSPLPMITYPISTA